MGFPQIKASAKGGKDFELVPAGVHFAVCTGVVHLGIQPSFSDKYPDKDQVYLKFEVPGVRVKWQKGGKDYEGSAQIGTFFTLSIGEKSNLRPFLEGWRGKAFTPAEEEGFNITSVLGKLCQLSVVHEDGRDGKTRAKINGAFGIIQEQKDKVTANPALGQVSSPDGLIAYTPLDHDKAVWDKLPEWLQKKIDGRIKDEPQKAVENENQAAGKADFDDDIPF